MAISSHIQSLIRFFNNEPLLEPFQGGVNSIIRGLAKDATQLTGIKMVEDLREFLFAVTGLSNHIRIQLRSNR